MPITNSTNPLLITIQDGILRFEVKWEGYDKKSDRTWEPEENLLCISPF